MSQDSIPEQTPKTDDPVVAAHANGHFYSPIVNPEEIAAQTDRVWPVEPVVLGIDFNDASHEQILNEVFPRHIAAYDYPEQLDESPELTQFYTQNSQFSWLDARTLFVLMLEWKPKRFVEVGSGFSTLLAADVNRRHLDNSIDITCIEPYPREFLRQGIPGIAQLLEQKVQDVPLAEFEKLQAGDILFIDSSHVAKTGSDVNYLYFEVLPRLAAGVLVHIHDIFLPHDYPREWVFVNNRSWNEQYLLRALLMHSTAFKVRFACSYAHWRFSDRVRDALSNGHSYAGGSFWMQRI